MKEKIRKLVTQYVKKYSERADIKTKWREPLVKFAAASDDLFPKLKQVVTPRHAMPKNFLNDAQTVISYFLPFHRSVINSNIPGKYSSHEWAKAFTETNKLILNLNKHMKKQLEQQGYKAAIVPAAYNYDEDKLICQWSHRHVAYIAGLGKFGLNNMLITEKGCCGRIGTVITNLKIPPSPRPQLEYCLYKRKGTCKKCVQRCVTGALKVKSYDRHKCYKMLLCNDKFHSDLELTDACGKCCVGLPCSVTNPVGKKS